MTLPDLLKTVMEMGGSDLHITTATPPQIRVNGHLRRLDMPEMRLSDRRMIPDDPGVNAAGAAPCPAAQARAQAQAAQAAANNRNVPSLPQMPPRIPGYRVTRVGGITEITPNVPNR